MKKEFIDKNRDLCVITTITNWNEPPRIRHELAKQLSKKYNVLFIQLYSQRGMIRKKSIANKNLIIESVGLFPPGGIKIFNLLPATKKIYNKIISQLIKKTIYKYNYSDAILINFQYDFPEVYGINNFKKTIYFCNDDFVNQNPSEKKSIIKRKSNVQSEVVKKSNLVIVTSYPLREKLEALGTKIFVILSGHSFNLNISKSNIISKKEKIRVCYVGFLNQYIAIDWLKYSLKEKNIHLTAIGPIAYTHLKKELTQFSNFHHITELRGEKLQIEMLKHDVLVMPYSSSTDNEITSAPAKLFQYLAVGKPIVSSDMQNLIKLPEKFIYKASNEINFLNLIQKAYIEDSELLKEHRIQIASKNTWNHRGNKLFEIINQIPREN